MDRLKQFFININPDVVVDKAAKAAGGLTYLGASGTVASGFFGLTHQEWSIVGIIVGICFTSLTYFTYLYFNLKKDRRAERELMSRIASRINSDE